MTTSSTSGTNNSEKSNNSKKSNKTVSSSKSVKKGKKTKKGEKKIENQSKSTDEIVDSEAVQSLDLYVTNADVENNNIDTNDQKNTCSSDLLKKSFYKNRNIEDRKIILNAIQSINSMREGRRKSEETGNITIKTYEEHSAKNVLYNDNAIDVNEILKNSTIREKMENEKELLLLVLALLENRKIEGNNSPKLNEKENKIGIEYHGKEIDEINTYDKNTKNLLFLTSLKAGKSALKKVEKVCNVIKFTTRVDNLASAHRNLNSNSNLNLNLNLNLNGTVSQDEKFLQYQTFCDEVRAAGEK